MDLANKHIVSSNLEPKPLLWFCYSTHIYWELKELVKIYLWMTQSCYLWKIHSLVRQKMNKQLTHNTTFLFFKKDKHIPQRGSLRDKGRTSQGGHQSWILHRPMKPTYSGEDVILKKGKGREAQRSVLRLDGILGTSHISGAF